MESGGHYHINPFFKAMLAWPMNFMELYNNKYLRKVFWRIIRSYLSFCNSDIKFLFFIKYKGNGCICKRGNSVINDLYFFLMGIYS